MKFFTQSITFLLCMHSLLYLPAQSADSSISLKVYSNWYLLSKYRAPLATESSEYGALEFGGFSPAIQWAGKKERTYRELELSMVRFKSSADEIRILKEREISIRYEFGRKRLSKNGGKSYWQRGWSLRTIFHETASKPLLPNGVPEKMGSYGFSFSYVPRYTLRCSRHFLLEANLILGFTFTGEQALRDDPNLTKRQRNLFLLSFELLDELPLRIGAVYRL